jgi:hypothetical protein
MTAQNRPKETAPVITPVWRNHKAIKITATAPRANQMPIDDLDFIYLESAAFAIFAI